MCLSLPHADLQQYPKPLAASCEFLELVTRVHMPLVLELPTANLSRLLLAIEEGLCSFETGVSPAPELHCDYVQ